MAAKKTKKVLSDSERRSKAARKGWVTRRRNELKKKLSNANKRLSNAKKAQAQSPKKKRIAVVKVNTKGKTKKQLEKLLRERDEKIAKLEEDAKWVNALDPEWISRDGHIALYPSRARHMGAATDQMLEWLQAAKAKGEEEYYAECVRIANIVELPIREIYTLGESP